LGVGVLKKGSRIEDGEWKRARDGWGKLYGIGVYRSLEEEKPCER
jgi:hypothetical protein